MRPAKSVRVKVLELIQLLADTGELDRPMRDLPHRERRAAAGVAVEFRQDESRDAQGLVEMRGHADRLLPRGGVGHQQDLLRLQRIAQALEFLDQRFVNFLAPGGIEILHVDAGLGGRPLRAFAAGLDEIGFARLRPKNRHSDLTRQRHELIDGSRPLQVAGDQHGAAAFLFEQAGELGGRGGFAGAVQAHHQDAGGRIEIERRGVAAEQSGQLIVENLNDLLAGRDAAQDILAERLGLDASDEVLGDLEMHVRLEQGEAHLAPWRH